MGVNKFLNDIAAHACCRGVINPVWLSQVKNINLYFYLVNTEPGWLQYFERQTKGPQDADKISHYVLYGGHDVLIAFHGSEKESNALLENITNTTAYDCIDFSVSQYLYFHRHRTRTPSGIEPLPSAYSSSPITDASINDIIDDYDNPAIKRQRAQLEEADIFLGPTWELTDQPPINVRAYVGINLRGPISNLASSVLLDDLLQDEVLRTCLVHFAELNRGKPFNYWAKVVCRDFEELDRVLLEIESRRIGSVTLGTTTFVVARGDEQMTRVTSQRSPQFAVPDTHGIEALAQATVGPLGAEAIALFNLLEPRLQPAVLDSLRELQEHMDNPSWDDEMRERVEPALNLFRRAVLEGASPGTLQGPVMNMSTAVEGALKMALEKIVRSVYGRDLGRAQNELKLRSRKFSDFALGNILAALRTIKDHENFQAISEVLSDEWLDRLEQFSENRNRWAHAGRKPSSSSHAEIYEARYVVSNGIDLIRWVSTQIIPAIKKKDEVPGDQISSRQIKLPEDNHSRQFGIFLSHSAADAKVANRIAMGLRALEYPVWYAEWAIKAGESIVEKISEALAQNDTLLVLLSHESVSSAWVRHEFTVALMDQLNGQDVTVIPILIEECPIPTVLRNIRYVDMRSDHFEQGFIKLLESLKERLR
ncbi:MAG: toll/interleukin-1 receptor domain-containing protein [Egibacteraceae bacterium]